MKDHNGKERVFMILHFFATPENIQLLKSELINKGFIEHKEVDGKIKYERPMFLSVFAHGTTNRIMTHNSFLGNKDELIPITENSIHRVIDNIQP